MLQLTALEDRCVNDKHQWDSAVKFLEKSLKERLEVINIFKIVALRMVIQFITLTEMSGEYD